MEITKELLEQYYVKEDKTRQEVAKLLGIEVYEVSNYAKLFGLHKLSASEKLEQLKLKYPVEKLKGVYDRVGYSGTLSELGLKGSELDSLVKAYQVGKKGKQARLESSVDLEELKKYYFQENHSMQETSEHFNCTGSQLRMILNKLGLKKERLKVAEVTKRVCLEKYGVESTNQVRAVKDRKKQTSFEKYGVSNPMQRQECRENVSTRLNTPEIIQKRVESLRNRTEEQKQDTVQKIRETKIQKYGEDFQNQFEAKSKNTLISKYGVPYSIPGHEKMKQTNLQRYGVENYVQSDECKRISREKQYEKYGGFFNPEKSAETKLERYGDINYNNREKAKATMLDKYGVECYLVSQDCYNKIKNDSKPNQAFAQLLEENGIAYEREFPIKDRSYDFKVGDTLIEIDPFATHNSTWGIKGGEPKDPRYHVEKTILARENGYQCMHIWDWDDTSKVVKMLLPKQRVYARKCKVKEIDQRTANIFLNEYHLQGRAKMQTVCAALYLGDELIQVMTFGKPRFNKHFQWELIRLCTKAGYLVIGGSEKLYHYFMEKYEPESIISYCDMSKFKGNVYTNLGMTLQSNSNPSRHWYEPSTGRQLTDNGVRMLGFDKLCNASFGKGTSNDELLREHGWVEIWDAGQAVFTWRR